MTETSVPLTQAFIAKYIGRKFLGFVTATGLLHTYDVVGVVQLKQER